MARKFIAIGQFDSASGRKMDVVDAQWLGKGTGNTVATVGGAAGGAYLGNEVEKKVKTKKMVKVSVKLDSGKMRDFNFEADNSPVEKGDRVHFQGEQIVRYTGK